MSSLPRFDDMVTQKVTVPFESDGGPAKHRIGLISLSSDVATEYDWQNMLPESVSFYTTRVPCFAPITNENLQKIGPHLQSASELLIPNQRLDVIAYSCTSGTVALGYEEVAATIRAGGRTDVPVVTPITSAISALRRLDVRRISLMTPYIDSVNQAMKEFLYMANIEVLNIGSFCLESDLDMADLSPSAIYKAALETCSPDADALFISCTAIRAVEVLEQLESELKRPVLSAIQTLFWESLRQSGYQGAINGYGSLLRVTD